jgi:predicted dehydrogenase
VADIGSHWVDLAEAISGLRLEAVMAELGTVHPRRPAEGRQTFGSGRAEADADGWSDVDTEDQAALLLRFGEGIQGALVLSQVAAGHKNALDLSLDGADASATWRQERPDQLWIGHRERPSELVSRDARTLSADAAAMARLPAGHNEGWGDGLRNLLAAAYDEIARRRAGGGAAEAHKGMPLPTFEDGARHLAFVEATLRSSAEGRWVSMSDVMEAVSA